jgi:hypothetical protein
MQPIQDYAILSTVAFAVTFGFTLHRHFFKNRVEAERIVHGIVERVANAERHVEAYSQEVRKLTQYLENANVTIDTIASTIEASRLENRAHFKDIYAAVTDYREGVDIPDTQPL